MRIVLCLGLCVLTLSAPGVAADDTATWRCRNADFEIGCQAGECRAADAHTAMNVRVGPTDVSVCAYSGCWAGAPSASARSGGFLTVTAASLPFSTTPDDRADVAVIIDTGSGAAAILVASRFATPATCAPDM